MKRHTEKDMKKFKKGTLKSSSGKKVTKRSQAVAIALRSARQKCGVAVVKRPKK